MPLNFSEGSNLQLHHRNCAARRLSVPVIAAQLGVEHHNERTNALPAAWAVR